jgi:hypothetical protein
MVKIPDYESPTLKIIDQRIEESQEDWRRAHLGGSLIGHQCDRFLWYSFLWFTAPDFSGRILRLFRRGHVEEPHIIGDLRLAGCEVSEGPEEGKQWRFEAHGGHFGGSMDAAILGLAEAPNTWHVGEFKTHNKKSFDVLVKDGVEKSKPQHYAQMQMYMLKFGMARAVYIAVCKDDDRYYLELVKYDSYYAGELDDKAARIIFADSPPKKLSERPDYYICKSFRCPHYEICHQGEETKERNCRTCQFSTPLKDGDWVCSAFCFTRPLSLDEQKNLAEDCPGYQSREG